ncbi:MAG: YesL family protein [Actinomycetaceae bacterium]|nr:YesL family protein [Actinomycetaceae bacterium]MDY5854334.1 YesL family protein [Arcanobacterium sp.]
MGALVRILSIDSPFGRALALIADVAIVSMCITLTALTVVPLGAGLAAGDAVLRQLVRDEGSRPWQTFWRLFRRSFSRATVGWIIWLVLVGLSCYELWLLNNAQSLGIVSGEAGAASFWRVGILSALIVLGMIASWFFPIVGQAAMQSTRESALQEHTYTFRVCVRLAVFAALRYTPISLAAVALWVTPVVLGVLYPTIGAGLVFFYIVFIPAFTLYLIVLMMDSRLARLPEES